MNFITDTHALLWWFTNSPKLSQKIIDIFADCERGENIIFIPSIVIAEALSIFDKKRVFFNFRSLLKSYMKVKILFLLLSIIPSFKK